MGCLLLLNPCAWNANGGYIGRAVESNGAFYDTGREVWDLVEQSDIDPWEVNEAFPEEQLDFDRWGFKLSLR